MEDNKNKQSEQAQDQQLLNENELDLATGGVPNIANLNPLNQKSSSTSTNPDQGDRWHSTNTGDPWHY